VVVCTFSLCAILDDRGALEEMAGLVRAGGLLLADHVQAASWPVRAVQRLIELVITDRSASGLRGLPPRWGDVPTPVPAAAMPASPGTLAYMIVMRGRVATGMGGAVMYP
jgi:hypothetical protein